MNQIMIGRYIPGTSWLHKLDPRIKLLSIVLYLVTIFLVPLSQEKTELIYSLIGLSALLVIILVITKSANISIMQMLKGLKSIIVLLTFTFIIQLFSVKTGSLVMPPVTMSISLSSIAAIIALIVMYQVTKKYIKFRILYFFVIVFLAFYVQSFLPYVEFTNYELEIYDVGLLRSGLIFLRITTIIITTSLLTFTTMTTDLNYGVESLLKPLTYIKVPVDIFAMLLSLTLRYIPTLLIETEKIMKAQASRGVDFNESSLKEKVVQIISLLIPVFVISFNRYEDLANAMEVKGYVIGAKRSKIDQYHMGFNDYFTMVMSLLLLGSMIGLKVML
ncbi:energy-coupling factor transporter transmembrane protein EcfT [Mycoplasmatota bacterium]|nr:energy-coupling factor transporter transmembrane protein EcfT [Mycoplasmatota bacterium]